MTELCDWLLDDSDELLEELDDSDELLLEELDEPLLTSVVVPLVQLTLAVQPGQAFGPWAASTFSAIAICCSLVAWSAARRARRSLKNCT